MPKQVLLHSGNYRLGRYSGTARKDTMATRRGRVHDSATASGAKKLITYIRVTVPVSNIVAVNAFGAGDFG
jgi:hypothetical protein